jgi:RsiW-degrading membrane proteinase PrsW (M82 family)
VENRHVNKFMNIILPFAAALIPTLLYTLMLWWLDRYEKEPLHLLLVTFVWGAFPALVIAIVAELAVGDVAQYLLGPGVEATIVAPVVEELLKAFVLIAMFIFVRREFNGVLDGIIYGALVGFGFAMSENILYFIAYSDQLVGVWLLRSIIFGFNHAFFTSIVGIALGLVRYERRRWVGYIAVPIALWIAILLHALHNSSTQIGFLSMCLAWVVNSGGILVVLATIVLSQRQELHWLSAELDEEVALNLITLAQFERVLNPPLRSRAELQLLLTRSWLAYRRLRRFHHLLTELAFVKHQLRQQDRFCCYEDVLALREAIHAMQPLLAEHGRHTVLS